jgi:hypothetical protein
MKNFIGFIKEKESNMLNYVYFVVSLVIGMVIANFGARLGRMYGTSYEIIVDTLGIGIWTCLACFYIYREPIDNKKEIKTKTEAPQIEDKDIQKSFNIMDSVDEYNEKIGTAAYYPNRDIILLDGIKQKTDIALKKIKKALKDIDKSK